MNKCEKAPRSAVPPSRNSEENKALGLLSFSSRGSSGHSIPFLLPTHPLAATFQLCQVNHLWSCSVQLNSELIAWCFIKRHQRFFDLHESGYNALHQENKWWEAGRTSTGTAQEKRNCQEKVPQYHCLQDHDLT